MSNYRASSKNVDLSICITALNIRDFTKQCLASIYKNKPKINFEAVVVDDGSQDGTSQMVRQDFPQVKLIVNDTNLGFTKSNNQAIKTSSGRYILVLNADTVVCPGALDKMVEFMDANPKAGMVGPMLLNEDKTLQRSCAARTPTLLTEFLDNFFLDKIMSKLFGERDYPGKYLLTAKEHEKLNQVASLSGACMLVRREAIESVGPLDERFFIYREETDWCFRILESSWKVYYLPEAQVIHYSGQTSKKWQDKGINYLMTSYYAYHRKYYGGISTLMLKCIRVGGAITKIVIFSIQYLMSGDKKEKAKQKIDFQRRVLKWHFRIGKR